MWRDAIHSCLKLEHSSFPLPLRLKNAGSTMKREAQGQSGP